LESAVSETLLGIRQLNLSSVEDGEDLLAQDLKSERKSEQPASPEIKNLIFDTLESGPKTKMQLKQARERYGVNRSTFLRALNELVESGIVQAVPPHRDDDSETGWVLWTYRLSDF
jgi:Fic family protein